RTATSTRDRLTERSDRGWATAGCADYVAGSDPTRRTRRAQEPLAFQGGRNSPVAHHPLRACGLCLCTTGQAWPRDSRAHHSSVLGSSRFPFLTDSLRLKDTNKPGSACNTRARSAENTAPRITGTSIALSCQIPDFCLR